MYAWKNYILLSFLSFLFILLLWTWHIKRLTLSIHIIQQKWIDFMEKLFNDKQLLWIMILYTLDLENWIILIIVPRFKGMLHFEILYYLNEQVLFKMKIFSTTFSPPDSLTLRWLWHMAVKYLFYLHRIISYSFFQEIVFYKDLPIRYRILLVTVPCKDHSLRWLLNFWRHDG